jgi:hypothetical protein
MKGHARPCRAAALLERRKAQMLDELAGAGTQVRAQ